MTRLALLVGVLSLLAFPSFAGRDERIQVSIEEPVQGERYSGISNLRGWAVSPEGTGNYYHSVYIDGEFAFYITPYGKRTDVGNTFPDYPNSDTAGFSMAFNYKDLSPGEHEIRVRAYDNLMNYNDAIATFTTERFESSFIASDSDVDVSTSETWAVVDQHTYKVSGATFEGKQWDFLLKWDKASQSFKTEGIVPFSVDNSAAGSSSGSDSGSSSGSGSSGGSDTPDVTVCASVGGNSGWANWGGFISGEERLEGDGYSLNESYGYHRTYRIHQTGCNLDLLLLIEGYLTIPGSISGSAIEASGQGDSKAALERQLEDWLGNNNIVGTLNVNADSISTNFVGTFYDGPGNSDGPRIFTEYTLHAEGTFATSEGTSSFEYSNVNSGNVYPSP